jgi:muramoyltetrapeptide carboxypeptidase
METKNNEIKNVPAYLQAGDKVGICCPAGALSLETIQPMITNLEFWGFEVVVGKTIGTSHHKYSDTDSKRLKDFQEMLDDDSIKAILFGRGGYGFVRIIDYVNFKKFVAKPKWLVGYSDITVLHNHMHTNYGIPTIHAHMSGGYAAANFDNESTMSIYHALTGKPTYIEIPTKNENEINTGTGILVGGNLAILSDLIGTPSDINTDGKILVIEDIGEYKHSVDRMLWQLMRSGKFDKLAGLIVGGFADAPIEEIDFGVNEYQMVWEKVQQFAYPVCFGFPVGHQPKNMALKLGMTYTLESNKNSIVLKEAAAELA